MVLSKYKNQRMLPKDCTATAELSGFSTHGNIYNIIHLHSAYHVYNNGFWWMSIQVNLKKNLAGWGNICKSQLSIHRLFCYVKTSTLMTHPEQLSTLLGPVVKDVFSPDTIALPRYVL